MTGAGDDPWLIYKRGVRPLIKQKTRSAVRKKSAPPTSARKKAHASRKETAADIAEHANNSPYVQIAIPPQRSVWEMYRPDAHTLKRLKTGKLSPAASLDLHGLTQAEAHRALAAFVIASHRAGHRCVLVITGKGSARKPSVLKEQVPRWLTSGPMTTPLVGIQAAEERHGGAGALYLMLKRSG